MVGLPCRRQSPPETAFHTSTLVLIVTDEHPAMPVRIGWQWLPLPHIDPYTGRKTEEASELVSAPNL
jgi:hypothetical protein